ncbi:DNA-dependent metalloprotease SPRTN [Chanos chanos]|uniref:DNA-dependent metalloprotease SPRTN n=1 Tax=Chanos chanos TaxID=29144 RepID=A0A6J2W0G1_CHACN|nr:sprT-like domain-containing protein Spartan [Chanos chanos]
MEDEDFLLALQLQEQYDYENSTSIWSTEEDDRNQFSKKRKVEGSGGIVPYSGSSRGPERPMSIVDESWEMLDPNPDVRAMFLEFNDMFFWGKLSGVEVKWSPRMTLCAGVCSYEGRGGLCSIRLSEPLLKLRPRRDLVQTLLHEMIHALLFVTQNNRDRDGHGPEFCKHMNRINQASGTKITVYHSFHDEVDVYRQHWWRCNGPCQNRRPFFGYVKRAMNRAPSARDPWWADHQRTCGGTYTKIKEPEGYGKKGKTEDNKDKNAPKKPSASQKNKLPSTPAASGSQDIRNIIPFSGKGFVLGGSSQTPSSSQSTSDPKTGPPRPQSSLPGQVSPKDVSVEQPPDKRTSTSTPRVFGKKSVSNTKAFVNINGSPVRIQANSRWSNPYGNPQDPSRAKQRSVHDLFQAKGQSPIKTASASNTSALTTVTKTSPIAGQSQSAASGRGSGLIPSGNLSWSTKLPNSPTSRLLDSHRSSAAGEPRPGSVNPRLSKPVGSPQKSGASVPGSRKRSWESRGSAHIFDYFQRAVSEASASNGRREEPVATPTSSSSSVERQASGSAASTVTVTVSCPVCQSRILESKINEHLDSCLT